MSIQGAFALFLCVASAFAPAIGSAQRLKTRWTDTVTPDKVHAEYPRPQLVRERWMNLNGLWEFSNIGKGQTPDYSRQILVPFPVESYLSRIQEAVPPEHTAAYRRTFRLPEGWRHMRVLLHFGAVDWRAVVHVNGEQVGEHQGGYDPFTLDITGALKPYGEQTLTVDVTDPTDTWAEPRGKQVLKPGGIFYTSTTGIWQTVWLEPVPQTSISSLKMRSVPEQGELRVDAAVTGRAEGFALHEEVLYKGRIVAKASAAAGEPLVANVRDAQLWSPEHPNLYDLRIWLTDELDNKVDSVESYSAFREVSIGKDALGRNAILLNGKPTFMVGPLDQGFWPDGLYTAPSESAMQYDISVLKRLGFNMLRKHVKVEPDRYYYLCDKLGMLVFQDMPSKDNGPASTSKESKVNFERELKAMIEARRNHPSIVCWVVFNEGWGQYDTPRLTREVKELDPTRLVDNASGWTDAGVGDLKDVHDYPGPSSPGPDEHRAPVLGEFGGLGLVVPGHTWLSKGWGYQSFKTSEALTDRFVGLIRRLGELRKNPGLSAAVYTQTTDVESELNGLMTYDREIIKMDESRIRKAIRELRD